MNIYMAVNNSRGVSIKLSGDAARTKFLNAKTSCKEGNGGKINYSYRSK